MFNKDLEEIKKSQLKMNNATVVGMQTSTAAMENSVNCHMTQQYHFWAYTLRKPDLKETCAPQCSSQHCL